MTEVPFPVVPQATQDLLGEKQLVDFRNHHRQFIEWLLVEGKDPTELRGYAEETAKRTAYRVAKAMRWTWDTRGGYRLPLTHEDAEVYIRHLAREENTQTHLHKTQHSLRRYSRWLALERGGDHWDPDRSFSSQGSVQPRDFLSVEERQQIRQAALDYGSIPAYPSLTTAQRAKWKDYVAQRLRKPREEVRPVDWDRVNGWKFTSLVWASLDAGLRPKEVGRARTGWVDTENGVLRIPAEEATKSDEHWTVSLTDRTTEALDLWLDERGQYPRYDDS